MFKTKAVLLKEEDLGEDDKILFFYTEKFGKIKVLALGAKKISSRLSPSLYFFSLLEIYLARKINFHLTGLRSLEIYKNINQNFRKNIFSQYILKILDQLVKLEKKDSKIFSLIIETLKQINFSSNNKTEIIVLSSLLKLVSFLGWRPKIYHCLNCGIKIRQGFFKFSKGGFICFKCHKNRTPETEGVEFNQGGVLDFKNMLYQPLKFWQTNYPPQNIIKLRDFLEKYLQYHSEIEIKYFDFIDKYLIS